MSNTYREIPVDICTSCEKPVYCRRTLKYGRDVCDCIYDDGWNCTHTVKMKVRDGKLWSKPPHSFKNMRQKRFRAKEREALHNWQYQPEHCVFPIDKNCDQYNWL